MSDSLTNRDAIAIATNWITASGLPFTSAFIGGSTAYADKKSPYDLSTDIDCYLVTDGELPTQKPGKVSVQDVLLDVSWMPWSELENAPSDAIVASLLHFGQVVKDDGRLAELQRQISRDFETPAEIHARVESIRNRIRPLAASISQGRISDPERVLSWLFPATLATHIPLVQAGEPLTVRKRFLAAQAVMDPDDYEELLALYGFDSPTPDQVQEWMNDTAALFDHTTSLAEESSRFWASDLSEDARVISIGGSQALIDAGFHREALFWIVATRARSLTIMSDMNVDTASFMRAFNDMTMALGIRTAPQRTIRTNGIIDWIER